jgi:hypothetical protein
LLKEFMTEIDRAWQDYYNERRTPNSALYLAMNEAFVAGYRAAEYNMSFWEFLWRLFGGKA